MSCALEPFCACVIDVNDDVIKLCAPHQDVVDKAVAAEREACAKIAERWELLNRRGGHLVAADVLHELAAELRRK